MGNLTKWMEILAQENTIISEIKKTLKPHQEARRRAMLRIDYYKRLNNQEK